MSVLLHEESAVQLELLEHPGAYIVYGPLGIGKTTAVLTRFPDAELIKAEDGTITIEQIQNLTRRLHLTSWNKSAVIIIDEAELLSHGAANAFLKTLEELPAYATVILVSHEPTKLLPTVRSRCQLIRLYLPGLEPLQEWLEGEFGLTSSRAAQLVTLSNHRPAVAVGLATDPSRLAALTQQMGLIESLFTADFYRRLQIAQQLQTQLPEVLPHITRYVQGKLRHRAEKRWVGALQACERAATLLASNANKRLVLDVIALEGAKW